jgi:hypothetical protein
MTNLKTVTIDVTTDDYPRHRYSHLRRDRAVGTAVNKLLLPTLFCRASFQTSQICQLDGTYVFEFALPDLAIAAEKDFAETSNKTEYAFPLALPQEFLKPEVVEART